MDGEAVFGQGRERLLRLIQASGSINAAARKMGIPYRKAWGYVDAMEKRLAVPLVNRHKGGAGGGEAALTPQAVMLLEKFEQLQEGFDDMVNRKFRTLDFRELTTAIREGTGS
jgi:molybdate transport system regulatory protein